MGLQKPARLMQGRAICRTAGPCGIWPLTACWWQTPPGLETLVSWVLPKGGQAAQQGNCRCPEARATRVAGGPGPSQG